MLGAGDAKEARRDLSDALNVVTADGYVPTNIVTEAASARSLDELAPTNPVAQELSSLRETMDEIHQVVRRTQSRLASTSHTVIEHLRKAVQDLVNASEQAFELNKPG